MEAVLLNSTIAIGISIMFLFVLVGTAFVFVVLQDMQSTTANGPHIIDAIKDYKLTRAYP